MPYYVGSYIISESLVSRYSMKFHRTLYAFNARKNISPCVYALLLLKILFFSTDTHLHSKKPIFKTFLYSESGRNIMLASFKGFFFKSVDHAFYLL